MVGNEWLQVGDRSPLGPISVTVLVTAAYGRLPDLLSELAAKTLLLHEPLLLAEHLLMRYCYMVPLLAAIK